MAGMSGDFGVNEQVTVKQEAITDSNDPLLTGVSGDISVRSTSAGPDSGVALPTLHETSVSLPTTSTSTVPAAVPYLKTESTETLASSPEKRVQIKRERTTSAGESSSSPSPKRKCESSSSRVEDDKEEKESDDGIQSCSKVKKDSHEEERMKMQ